MPHTHRDRTRVRVRAGAKISIIIYAKKKKKKMIISIIYAKKKIFFFFFFFAEFQTKSSALPLFFERQGIAARLEMFCHSEGQNRTRSPECIAG